MIDEQKLYAFYYEMKKGWHHKERNICPSLARYNRRQEQSQFRVYTMNVPVCIGEERVKQLLLQYEAMENIQESECDAIIRFFGHKDNAKLGSRLNKVRERFFSSINSGNDSMRNMYYVEIAR